MREFRFLHFSGKKGLFAMFLKSTFLINVCELCTNFG